MKVISVILFLAFMLFGFISFKGWRVYRELYPTSLSVANLIERGNTPKISDGGILNLAPENLDIVVTHLNGLNQIQDKHNLRQLEVAVRAIHSLEDVDWNEFPNLKKLYFKGMVYNLFGKRFYRDETKVFHEDMFADFEQLETLLIGLSAVEKIEKGTFNGLKNLKEVHINSTNASVLSSELFKPLSNLKSLYLADNNISVIEKGAFEGLENITFLDLSGNVIKDVDILIKELRGLPTLQHVVLDGNPISEPDKQKLRNALSDIKNVQLSY